MHVCSGGDGHIFSYGNIYILIRDKIRCPVGVSIPVSFLIKDVLFVCINGCWKLNGNTKICNIIIDLYGALPFAELSRSKGNLQIIMSETATLQINNTIILNSNICGTIYCMRRQIAFHIRVIKSDDYRRCLSQGNLTQIDLVLRCTEVLLTCHLDIFDLMVSGSSRFTDDTQCISPFVQLQVRIRLPFILDGFHTWVFYG